MMMSIERDWTFTQHKKYLTRINFYQRFNVKKKVIKKSNIFIKQYQLIRLEAADKARKYIIILRFDSEEYRRWKNVNKNEGCFAIKSKVTYQWNLLTFNPAERSDIVRITYDLNSKTQIRDFQQLLCVNISNNEDITWRIFNIMRLIKINIWCDKISNMLFLNDLSLFEIFQKVYLDFIFSIIHEFIIQ